MSSGAREVLNYPDTSLDEELSTYTWGGMESFDRNAQITSL
jgi:hypothetical protein